MKRTLAALLAILTLLTLCGCGSKSASAASYASDYVLSDSSAGETESYSAAVDTAAAESAPDAGSGLSAAGAGTGSSAAALNADKIIYSCTAEVETQTFEETCQAVTELIDRVGGFLESSSVNGNYYGREGARSADYTIRIPRERFDEVTGSLSELGNVPYCRTEAENVTADYRDTESRLAVYQTEEDRLLAMLEQAETVEDMLAIEDRLADVRYNIESLTSSLQNWDSLVSYSTLVLTVQEVTTYTETAEPSYWQSVRNALALSLQGVADFARAFLRFLIAALPVLLILAVLAGIVTLCVKGGKKRRAKKRAKALARQTAPEAAQPPVSGEKKS